MWGQVSLKKALKGYLTGRTVKAVDLSAEVVRDLSEVMEALSDGVVFFSEVVAVENIEFQEEVEDMAKNNVPDNATEAELVDWIVDGPKDEADDYDRRDPTASAAVLGLGDGMTKQKGTEPEAPKRKKPHTHKTLEQTEAEWANRKIADLPKLRALCKTGWKVKDLAVEFQCTEQTVRNTMKREGIG